MALVILAVILGLMISEARVAWRNEAALRLRGAVEPPGDVYRLMTFLYPACFIAMGLEGYWRQQVELAGPPMAGGLLVAGALLFIASKGLKYWAISALGPFWTFRVLVLPGVTLVTHGPYRYIAHPNYIAVVGELAGTAMMMSAWVTGPIALAAFGATLRVRIRVENRALAELSRK